MTEPTDAHTYSHDSGPWTFEIRQAEFLDCVILLDGENRLRHTFSLTEIDQLEEAINLARRAWIEALPTEKRLAVLNGDLP